MSGLPEELREAVEALPTVAECDERIADAQHVLDHPDEYDVEVRVDASRSQSRWQRFREYAAALATLTAHLSRQHELLREAEKMLRTILNSPAGEILTDRQVTRLDFWLARYREQEEGL